MVNFRTASPGVGGSWLRPQTSWVKEPHAHAAWWPSERCKVGGLRAGRAQGCRSSQPPLGDMTNGRADKSWSAFHLGAVHGFAFKAGKQTTGSRHNTHRPQMIQPFSPLKSGTCKRERKTALLEFLDEEWIQKTPPGLGLKPTLHPLSSPLLLTSLRFSPLWCSDPSDTGHFQGFPVCTSPDDPQATEEGPHSTPTSPCLLDMLLEYH